MGFSVFTDLITPTKYKVPDAPEVDIQGEQLANVKATAATFDEAKDLAGQYNDWWNTQVQDRLKKNMPYLQDIETQTAANIAKRIRGILPDSDAAASQRSSAARALGSGINVGALTTRDLMMSQTNLMAQGEQQGQLFAKNMADIKQAPWFDFSKMFLTAGQRIDETRKNLTARWNVQNLRNQMAVQPEPWMKSLAGFGDSILDAVASYYTGGMSSMGGDDKKKDTGSGGWNSPWFNSEDSASIRQYNLG
jgi:hypothetical protein